MYTIDKYLNDIVLLTSSLVIKHHDIGVVMNKWLLINNGIEIPTDKRLWKYYLNISGEKHTTNNDVKIVLAETKETISLTKNILIQYPETRIKYDSRLNSYKALLRQYPDDTIYINGCINPVDIDIAISSPNGTILSYSNIYIEPQEYSMARELSTDLSLFIGRWYIREYNITDELYMASFLSVMYSSIPNMIASIRLRSIFTSEAHSFHVEHFFRSHLDLWDNVKGLNKTTIWWLYRNLKTLINSVGVTATLDTIIKEVFTPNGIGLASFQLSPTTHKLNDPNDINAPMFSRQEPVFTVSPLNTLYKNEEKTLLIKNVVDKMVNNATSPIFDMVRDKDIFTRHTVEIVSSNVNIVQPTKIIDFGKVVLFSRYTNSITETILDNWLVLASSGQYNFNVRFIDPNTKDLYILNPMSGLKLFYYLLFLELGITNPVIYDINHKSSISNTITRTTLIDGLLLGTGYGYVADIILSLLPTPRPVMTNTTDFKNNIDQYVLLYETIWEIDSNVNNTFLSADIKKMVSKLYTAGSVVISPTSAPTDLKFMLQSLGINVNVTNTYDFKNTISELFTTFTGYILDPNTVMNDLYKNLDQLLNKITSYSIKTLSHGIVTGSMLSPYTTLSVNNPTVGFISVTDAGTVTNLEVLNANILGNGNDITTGNITTTAVIDNSKSPQISVLQTTTNIQASGFISRVCTRPITTIELLDEGYSKFRPTSIGSGNSLNIGSGVATYSIGTNGLVTNESNNNIFVNASNTTTTVTGNVTAELVTSNYTKP